MIDRPALRPLTQLPAPFTRLQIVAQSPSTNAELLAHPEPGLVLVAEHQTAGQGRLGRVWNSPPRSCLTVSMALDVSADGLPVNSWGWLPLLAGVALVDAVAEPQAQLKWPNDLLWAPTGDKLAGILVQSDSRIAVIGIGLNVTVTADELPIPNTSSLQRVGAAECDRSVVLSRLLRHLGRRYQALLADGPDQLATAYRERCLTIGQQVRVSTVAGTELVGTATDIDQLGRLLLRESNGVEQIVSAGDVHHLRLVEPGIDGAHSVTDI